MMIRSHGVWSSPLPLSALGSLGLCFALMLGVALGAGGETAIAFAQSREPSQRRAPAFAQGGAALQGETLLIGDTVVAVPWQRRGDRLGLADLPLMHTLGIDLQSTNAVGQQPVLWFSDQADALPTWYANGYRYLDITDWARQRGWQWQENGDRLRLQAPVGQVTVGRRGQQTWGDRIVLEVDRPVLWHLSEQPGTFDLTLQANPGSTFQASALNGNGNLLSGLEVAQAGGRLRLRGRFADTARPRVWSLSNPNRVVIDITQQNVVPRDILWAPGLRWRETYQTVGDRAFPVHQLWLDLQRPELAMNPIWTNPDAVPGTAPLSTTARRWGAYAAINAGFFNRNNQLPLGALRREGRWISGPILNRGAIAWDNAGAAVINRLFLAHTLTTDQGKSFPIGQINSGYVQAGIGLYTPDWGRTYSPVLDNEVLVTVNQNQVVQQGAGGAAGAGAFPIPVGGYLLAVRSYTEAVQSLGQGRAVRLTPDLRPAEFDRFPHAVGGGPLLIKDGQIVLNAQAEGFSEAFATQAAPRSFICTVANGQIVLAAMHYSPGGRGATLGETAQVARQLGCVHALNLDGGASTSLYLGGYLLNRLPQTVGRVHNGLGVFW